MSGKNLIMLMGVLLLASTALAASVTVTTEQAVIRKDKRFFAPPVARVSYGTLIEVLEDQGDWRKVSYQDKQGWVHISAVQEKKFRLSSLLGEKAGEASKDEVALAGKGFTPEVEKAFRAQNPKMQYHLVDQVSSRQLSEAELRSFIREGLLREPGGES